MRPIRFVTVAVLILLSACTASRSTQGVVLSVRSYDRATGACALELHNNTSRPILFLNPYLTFNNTRSPALAPFPESPDGMVLVVHDTRLAPADSVTLTGRCPADGTPSQTGTFVAIRACWFTEEWTCEAYFPVWSETTLDGH